MERIKRIYDLIPKAILTLTLFISLAVLFMMISTYSTAYDIGNSVGKTTGGLIGNVSGFFEGMKKGIEDGNNDSRKPDIEIDVGTAIRKEGMLEVLSMYLEAESLSTNENNDYGLLRTKQFKVIYKVDLSNANIVPKGGVITIEISKPIATVIEIPNSEKEIDKFGKNNDKFDEIIKKLQIEDATLIQSVNEKMNKENGPIEKAKAIAIKQIQNLVKSISDYEPVVVFK